MSNLYGASHIASEEEIAKSETLFELYLVDDIMRGTQEQIHGFCESMEAQVLVEKQVLNKPTLVRMSKQGDFHRRIKLTSYLLAKQANDPNFAKLVKYQALKKQYANKVLTKYGKKAARIAKIAQKEYIKKSKSVKATAQEIKAQSAH